MPMLKALIVKNFEAKNRSGLYEYGQFYVRIRWGLIPVFVGFQGLALIKILK